ncbi:MAG: hypothetical protein WAM90_19210 [Rhodanobacter sp.]
MPRRNACTSATASTWYRQPVLWLGVVVFAASMAGCVWLIVMSSRHADIPVDTSHTVFGVPVGSRSSSASP